MLIVDASPLIVLARIGRVDLLGADVLVPHAVSVEVPAGPAEDPARILLEGGRLHSIPPAPIPDNIVEWGLGAGESAVLAAACVTRGSEAVLDDGQGRKCAAALQVPVVGTLGLVIRATRSGRLARAAPTIRELRASGMRLDEGLVEEVLRRVLGETWDG